MDVNSKLHYKTIFIFKNAVSTAFSFPWSQLKHVLNGHDSYQRFSRRELSLEHQYGEKVMG